MKMKKVLRATSVSALSILFVSVAAWALSVGWKRGHTYPNIPIDTQCWALNGTYEQIVLAEDCNVTVRLGNCTYNYTLDNCTCTQTVSGFSGDGCGGQSFGFHAPE